VTPSDGPDRARFRERFFTSQDGLRLYFRDYGGGGAGGRDRPAVLCLPGLARNSKDFHHVAQRLAFERRVVCPDYRGRGRSDYDPNWRNYEARTYVGDLRHLLAALNLHRVVVIGTSLGGMLAMALAVAAPQALEGAVINDVGPEVDAAGLGRIVRYIRGCRPQPDWEAAARYLRQSMPNLSIETNEDWIKLARNTYRERDDGLLHPDWDANLAKPLLRKREPPPDLWPLFRALRPVPTLALRGGASDVLSAETFARMKAEKPDLVQVTLAGVGHPPFLGEPEAVAAIDAFLASLPAES
jgi:pimeloyl-ACP methyl ester carboxylesterase